MRLYGILFPSAEICREPGLYYHGKEAADIQDGKLFLHKGQKLTFDTCFNAFPSEKYRRYTRLERLGLHFRFRGKVRVCCYARTLSLAVQKLGESVVYSERALSALVWWPELSTLPQSLLLYFSLEGLEDSQIWDLQYQGQGNQEPKRLAVVTCTYHREQEVMDTHWRFWKKLHDTTLWERLDFWIVDNGRTLRREQFPQGNIRLIPSPNHGGSGGFGRGMQEVRRDGRVSHMILMDDDILMEPGSLERLDAFLSLLRPEYDTLCVGGGMLYRDEPFRQFEAGGMVEGGNQWGHGHYLDLQLPENVAKNEMLRRIDYNGWWLMCLSIKGVGEELPMPFFLKYDDVEFCLRCQFPIITLNGFCVWHELFEKKYNTSIEYYQARNFCFAFENRMTQKELADYIQKKVIKKLRCHQYNAARMIVRGYEEYRKGRGYLESLDPENLHRQLLAESEHFLNEQQLREEYGVIFQPEYFRWGHESKAVSWRRRLTLNGYLVPRRFYPKEPIGYRITHAIYDTEDMYFGADRVLHYNPFTHTGYVSRISLREYARTRYRLWKVRHKARHKVGHKARHNVWHKDRIKSSDSKPKRKDDCDETGPHN